MLLALDVLPGVFVGAHVLAELSSPTFGRSITSIAELAAHEDYICQVVDEVGLDYGAVADRFRSEKSIGVSTMVVRGYLKRLDASRAAPSTAAIGSAAPAVGATFATVADLAVHEAYVRHLVDAEGLGYKQIAHKLAVDKAISVKPKTVQNYMKRLARSKAAGAIFATVADLAVHEAYVRHLVDAEGLGYKAILSKLRVEKAITVKAMTVRNYLERLARPQAARAIRIGTAPPSLPGLYFGL